MKYNAFKGSLLALTTAICWGILPVALQQLVVTMDPKTIVWYRFVFAALLLGLFLTKKRQLPKISLKQKYIWIALLMAGMALVINFLSYNVAVVYLSPSVLQVIMQLSPITLLLVSIPIFKTTFFFHQKIGVVILIIGITLFFNDRLIELFTSFSRYTLGVAIGVFAALIWVVYAVIQRFISKHFSSSQILFALYCICAIFISPFAKPTQLFELSNIQLLLFTFCVLNTVVGYGAFAEAMACWSPSNVSAVITLAPLFTILLVDVVNAISPGTVISAELNLIGYIGAITVVLGVITCAIGDKFLEKYQQN